jgi:hypothetical protein
MQDLYDWWHKDYIPIKDHFYDAWYQHYEKHSRDTSFKCNASGDPDENGDLWCSDRTFETEELEEENNLLHKKARELEEKFEKELNSRLHRIIEIIPYMWT